MRQTLLRLLRLHDATPAERAAALWTAAFFFCVLGAYYLLRPLREEVAASLGTENLSALFTLTFVFIAVLNPPYMVLANRMPSRRFVPFVLHGFALSFAALAFVWAGMPELEQGVFSWSSPVCLVAAFFYSWVTAFVVCGVALVWVHAVDYFTGQQGRRLFGLVSVGGTVGQLVGSALARVSSQLSAPYVTALAVVALELAVLCFFRSLAACLSMRGGELPATRVAASGAFRGIALLFRSGYLLGIASFVMLGGVVATAFYYSLNQLTVEQIPDSAARRVLFADINLLQGLAALALQVWATRTVLLRVGVGAVLCAMPLVSLLGVGLAALAPPVLLFAGYEVVRRTVQFAFDKPAREVLYTPLGLDEKYKSKAFIDTVGLRFGDLVGSWISDWLLRVQAAGSAVALGMAPAMAAWGVLGFWLGRRCRQRETGVVGGKPTPGS